VASCDVLLKSDHVYAPPERDWLRQLVEKSSEIMLTCTPSPVNAIDTFVRTFIFEGGLFVADVQIDDGIIKILNLDVQDPKAAAVLAEYPQVRWAEITRRALKIGLGYLKGGARD
jgi:hypothetical protein